MISCQLSDPPAHAGGVSAFGYSGTIVHALLLMDRQRTWPRMPPLFRRVAYAWGHLAAKGGRDVVKLAQAALQQLGDGDRHYIACFDNMDEFCTIFSELTNAPRDVAEAAWRLI